jgi:lysophospholipase L1-like esterase
MNTTSYKIRVAGWLGIFLALTGSAQAEQMPAPAVLPPITLTDVPRETQAGPQAFSRKGVPAPFPANPALPTLWLIGDSTVRNGTLGNGSNGQWGWGAPIVAYFDLAKINVVNRAVGGTSARTFYRANWKPLVELLKRGDVVLMQFGTNDGGTVTTSAGELRGIGEETQDIVNREKKPETIHTFGWYLRQIIGEAKAKGATPVVCSLIPRKIWGPDGHLQRSKETFAGWAGQVARAEGVGFIDLNDLIARRYDVLGKEEVDRLYWPHPSAKDPRGEHVHPGWEGAVMNAGIVVSGLKALKHNPLAPFFSPRAESVAPAVPPE